MEFIDDFTHERLRAIDRVAAACRAHRKRWGPSDTTPDYAALLIEKGCTLISATSDMKLVSGPQAYRNAFGGIL